MPVCDGCGLPVDDEHIRQRIQRLELATRFRPVHIHILLIDAAPPSDLHDFFYAAANGEPAIVAQNPYFRELAKLAERRGDPRSESVLAEFQRRGLFLTYAVECPMSDSNDLLAAVRQLAPTVLRRVQSSYKPKHVALISEPTAELIQPFREAGWGDRLILDGNGPFPNPREASGTSGGNKLAGL